ERRTFSRFLVRLAAVTAAAHVLLLLSFIVRSGFFSLEGAIIIAVPALLWIWIVSAGVEMLRRGAP
ncbi:MAG: hypothetical protein ACTHJM_00830, partial [Marmoricola sp.]